MKHLYLFFSFLALSVITASAQTTLTDADLQNAYSTKTYSHRLSCHDPSIVMDNITNPSSPVYYVYGSHLGHGVTTAADNYQSWDDSWAAYEVTGTANSLFANANGERINFADAYGNAHSWQNSGYTVLGNQWAPDIIYNTTMKKWCLYMSLNGDHWCSSIVLFTSDSPRGQWVNQGVVTYSGFSGTYAHNGYTAANDYTQTDLQRVIGNVSTLPERYNVGASWGTYWPNDIDPCVFYDDDNNLWMSYGSWSGGIFLLKLDASTGLRDYTYTYPYEVNGVETTPGAADANCTSDPYFGKKIAGGYYVSGEGSYIQKIGNYWFLFMSYGGLNPSQGYQMRVFRSDKATGPYVDANGTSAIYDKYLLNYSYWNTGSSATWNAQDNRGVLLMEGYKWETMPKGEVAQGHNSAFVDAQGRAFVVYHTKFNDGTFGHEVRVHQLFLNEDGWLVAAPYEFNGETITNEAIASTASISDSEIPGDYQFIRHKYDQSHEAVSSSNVATRASVTAPVNINLSSDGRVTSTDGSVSGTWERKANTDFITLTLSGVEYKGVLVRQTIDYTNISSICIAALSDNSGSTTIGQNSYTNSQEIWASKADAKAAIKYTLDKADILIEDGDHITSNIPLPEDSRLGAKMSWTSSNPNIFDTDFGEVTGNGAVTLTMTIKKDDCVYNKVYNVTVGDATGISSITTNNSSTNGKIYNLSGQQVDENYHGVIIKNGKKIIKR